MKIITSSSFGLLLLLAVSGRAGEPSARCLEVPGALLQRTEAGDWVSIGTGKAVAPGRTVVALPRAKLLSSNEAVEIEMLADLAQRGPYPVLESAIQINALKDYDVEVKLERGIIALKNRNSKGSAKVLLHIENQSWTLSLAEPGTTIFVEIYGRHSAGVKAVGQAIRNGFKEKDTPNLEVVMLAAQGRALIDFGKQALRIVAPPGPARLHWNNSTQQVEIDSLDKLPEMLTQPPSDELAKKIAGINAIARRLDQGKPRETIRDLFAQDPALQKIAITAAGATDDLDLVLQGLGNEKSAANREHAILVLRHWLGRESGQVKNLYERLIPKVTPVQARGLLQLLVGFDAEEKQSPVTYEALISMLNHADLRARTLSHWHLVRLAPVGAEIPYDAASPESARLEAQRRWQALIPTGQLPPPSSTKK